MTPLTWLDAHGGRRSTLAGWTCGREVAPMLFRAGRSCRRSRCRTSPAVRRSAVDAMGDGLVIALPIWGSEQAPSPLRRAAGLTVLGERRMRLLLTPRQSP